MLYYVSTEWLFDKNRSMVIPKSLRLSVQLDNVKRTLASATDFNTRILVDTIFGSISNKCYIQQLFSYLCYFYEASSETDLLELCIATSGIELEETDVGYFF